MSDKPKVGRLPGASRRAPQPKPQPPQQTPDPASDLLSGHDHRVPRAGHTTFPPPAPHSAPPPQRRPVAAYASTSLTDEAIHRIARSRLVRAPIVTIAVAICLGVFVTLFVLFVVFILLFPQALNPAP